MKCTNKIEPNMYHGDDFARFECGTEMEKIGEIVTKVLPRDHPTKDHIHVTQTLYQCPSCKTTKLI